MTVYHILPDHDLGGGVTVTAALIRSILALGRGDDHVAVLPENATPPMRAVFEDLPHRIAPYPGRGAPWKIAKAILGLGAGKGDVVHGQGTRAALAAMIARPLGGGFRTAYTVHGFHGLAQPGPFQARVRLERLLARRMDATVFVSHADAALAREAGLRHRGPAVVIENGIAAPEVAPDAPQDIDILFVGRMVYQKHPQAFIETLAKVEGAPRAVIIGAGEMAEEVDGLIAEKGLANVLRHDGLPFAQTLAHMGRARLLVMTSRWEGLPTVAIEAAQSRALVCGYDIPPLAEVLEEVGAETLTPSDPAALAAKITALLDDEGERRALADKLHDRVRERFSPRAMAERYVAEVYDPLS
ncbi:glycosyltransferase family 4 protein [Rhodovulum sp. DZ06]|uniref:glycosyltransferase family 4 protein n=1 Tax=Rhodovulum sp. DZ06 TaxID=3425126 RepID=UPI003D33BCE8